MNNKERKIFGIAAILGAIYTILYCYVAKLPPIDILGSLISYNGMVHMSWILVQRPIQYVEVREGAAATKWTDGCDGTEATDIRNSNLKGREQWLQSHARH